MNSNRARTFRGAAGRHEYLICSLLLFAMCWNGLRVVSILFGNPLPLGNGLLGWLFGSPMRAAAPMEFEFWLAVFVVFFHTTTLWVLLGVRQLARLGYSRWLALLFLVPGINFGLFILLCIGGNVLEEFAGNAPEYSASLIPQSRVGSGLVAIILTATVGTVMVCLATRLYGIYGMILFILVPFELGLFSALIYSWHQRRSFKECLAVSLIALAMVGLCLLAFAIEGFFCIAMAIPIALGAMIPGTLAGFLLQRFVFNGKRGAALAFIALITPILMGAEGRLMAPSPIYAVRTSLHIGAPPETVWRNVVSFNELAPPSEYIFRTGVAYPIRAEIHGAGVGAVRHCVFSTGPFVEPITVWDEPRRLAFDVIKQPHALEEWSPWGNITPRHLDGYFQSTRGEFLLTPDGIGTHLQGTTWYRQQLAPRWYWKLWSDYLIHRIHRRVLEHIAMESGRRIVDE